MCIRDRLNALQLCDEAIRLYPGYRRINALKNLREEILAPYLNVNASDLAFPNEEIELRVSHKNLDGDRKSTRLNSSHLKLSRMPSSA